MTTNTNETPHTVTVDFTAMPTNKAHLRAARALLEWTSIDVSQKSGVSVSTVLRLERGNGPLTQGRYENIKAIAEAYQKAGIGFFDGPTEIGAVIKELPSS